MGIQVVELTSEEFVFYQDISFSKKGVELSQEDNAKGATAAVSLTCSLFKRNAIPKIRIRYFIDPDYNVHSKKSHRQIFEMNGRSGNEIYKSAHFWPFLYYFINGPHLPNDITEAFLRIVGAEPFISGSDMPGLRKFARSETRKHELDPKVASEEFYKHAIECGINERLARIIRNNVHAIR